MLKKMTPQGMYEAYRNVTSKLKQKGILPESRALPPGSWEEVSEEEKAICAKMALKMNSIVAEFTTEEIRR
jgi:hypothetical protein